MLDQPAKQAIIVYQKQEATYSHFMANLITDYAKYEIAEWNEKDWLANNASISSSQKMIFLGDTKETRERHHGMNWKFDSHNMKYGWLGNQCIVLVTPLPRGLGALFMRQYTTFVEQLKKETKDYEAIANKYPVLVPIPSILMHIPPIPTFGELVFGNTQLVEYQYDLLIREFVLNGALKQFMEG